MYKLTLDNSQNFILGGKADFIVSDINNKDHINFQVRQDVKQKNIYYVKYKSLDWIYLGYIKTTEVKAEDVVYYLPEFFPVINRVTDQIIQKSSIFNKMLLYIYYIQKLPSNIEITYTGRCSICGRKLTDPEYIELGIGKHCLENWKLHTDRLKYIR